MAKIDDYWKKEIERLDKQTARFNHASKKAIAYCEDCGGKIYQTDEDGLPFRLCFQCSRK